MHFFIQNKQRQKQIQKQKMPIQIGDNVRKVIKKIVVKRKPKDIFTQNNQIEVQSQDHAAQIRLKQNQRDYVRNQLQTLIKMNSLDSFATQQNETGGKTPFLNYSPPSCNFQTMGRNTQTQPVSKESEGKQERQRSLQRVMSKPIQPLNFEDQSRKANKKMRKTSIQTDFQIYSRQPLQKSPTQMSFQARSISHQQLEQPHSANDLTRSYGQTKKVSILKGPSLGKYKRNSQQLVIQGPGLSKFYIQKMMQQNINQSNNLDRQNDEQLQLDNIYQQERTQTSLANDLFPSVSRGNQDIQMQPSNSTKQLISFVIQQSQEDQSSVQYTDHKKNGQYQSYIERQSKELQMQRQRMIQLSDQANKVIYNGNDSQSQHSNNYYGDLDLDKSLTTLKYILQQLVQLFCIGQVIKYQLNFRIFEILNKIYAQATNYYQQKIVLQEPIKAYTFALSLKALLTDYENSQLDIILTNIFNSAHQLSFDDFFGQFQSVLNSKQVALFQPQSMKRQLDRTLDKIKRLFVIWIEIQYFTKKVKQILRQNKVIYESIFTECSNQDQPDKFDIQLIQKFLLQTSKKSHIKKLKIDIFFRNLIGNQLLKSRWSEWVYTDRQELYNRYENRYKYQRNQLATQSSYKKYNFNPINKILQKQFIK